MDHRRDQFEDLVRQHLDWVYSSARRRVRDAALADDVTQATFIVLWRKLAQVPTDHRLTGWLYRTIEAKSDQDVTFFIGGKRPVTIRLNGGIVYPR